jgi:hypothetical protein
MCMWAYLQTTNLLFLNLKQNTIQNADSPMLVPCRHFFRSESIKYRPIIYIHVHIHIHIYIYIYIHICLYKSIVLCKRTGGHTYELIPPGNTNVALYHTEHMYLCLFVDLYARFELCVCVCVTLWWYRARVLVFVCWAIGRLSIAGRPGFKIVCWCNHLCV